MFNQSVWNLPLLSVFWNSRFPKSSNCPLFAKYSFDEIYEGNHIKIKIRDWGCGIDNVKQAMEPLYTTMDGDKAGLGFSVMESFMDSVKVYSNVGKGTTIVMKKTCCSKEF